VHLRGESVFFKEIVRWLEHGPEAYPTRVGVQGHIFFRHRKGENVHGHLHLAPGMGHGIDPMGLALGGQFLNLAARGLLKNAGEGRCVYKPS